MQIIDENIDVILFDDVRSRLVDDPSTLCEESISFLLAIKREIGKDARHAELSEDIYSAIEKALKKEVVPNDPTMMDEAAVAIALDAKSFNLKLDTYGLTRTRAMYQMLLNQLDDFKDGSTPRIDWRDLELELHLED